MEPNPIPAKQSVCALVESKARLHLGFLDMSGTLGRRFGSLGLSIDAFSTRVRVEPSLRMHAEGPDSKRGLQYAQRMANELKLNEGLALTVESAIPGHLGLGSGTQLALAVGRAVAALAGANLSTRDVAAVLQRGARSGIGIGAFDEGGFLVDSGVGADGCVPPVTARLPFPAEWRVLLVLDARGQGLHGRQELEAFRRLPPFPRELAAHLCHLTLMQILPGIDECRLQPVAEGIAELQRRVGDHFASAQGGRFTSPAVADALQWIESLGFPGIGQSSWGPTGFALLPGEREALEILAEARQRFGDLSPLRFRVARGFNEGSLVAYAPTMDIAKEHH
ncbi:MAG: GHMP kinase [Gammaproteobacteria bacterium]|nr:GHMP kinase [Gammaproteobacteria bacterium]